MNNRALDLLPEYVLGTLSDAETREVEEALAQSAELRAEADEVREAFDSLVHSLPAARPNPSIKHKLMSSVRGAERYAPFASSLARHFDLAVDKVRDLLRAIHDPQTDWDQGPLPGIMLMHFSGGPRVATADVGFVRLPRGLHFPWHRHNGYEVNYVLEGSLRDFDGRVYGPGEAIEKAKDTEHEFFVGDDQDAVIAVVVEAGFDIIPKPGS